MARSTESACHICRRENMKMYLKGDRCYSDKCALDRRPYPPGQHGQGRVKNTEYGVQLREKQKVKRMYGMLEKQFSLFYDRAAAKKGKPGDNLLQALELRLDNVAYRAGFADSRNEARQLVRHGHINVNGHRVNIPSYKVSQNDVIEVREGARKIAFVNKAIENISRRGIPGWLEVDGKAYKATVKVLPCREDITLPINEQLIVELYSK